MKHRLIFTGKKLIREGRGEAAYAHLALQKLHITPGALMALPPRERAFVYASLDLAARE